MNRRILLLTLLPLLLVAAACGSSDDGTNQATDATDPTAAEATTETTTSPDDEAEAIASSFTCEEVAASFATKGSANAELPDPEVSASCEGDTVSVTTNGIPDHTYVESSPGTPEAVDLSFTIPATPTMAAETTDVPRLGAAAVALNGVPIYGPTEATGGDVLSLTGALSECGSHNGPTGFHIHLLGTSDSTDCIFTPEEVVSAPQLLGFALDGYPIYTGNDQHTSSWRVTDESLFASDTWSAHTYVEGSGDLDECNGMVGEDGSYAYYTTDEFPYVLGCYRGEVDLDASGGGPPEGAPGGGQPPA